ncbi:hypothetical protein C6568_14045 [Melaminivora suipulveris]|uniref:DUF2782 domain-containing protein n=1 Tax=Melaminivora suipulveris TaxID=2109913 RepID=A0A2R3QEP2_9BURK|nr:hypothetical protein [Melaminivora suipulveris]AVO50242.1 hypothetical protein C6568_14045 [Melaminivora suipulveris]
MRAPLLLTPLLLALASLPALAQDPAQNSVRPNAGERSQLPNQEQPEPLEGRRNQRVQRIVVEDAGSRVDELRVGGQTQSITVQPKTAAALPSYEVRAQDGARARPGNLDASDTVTAPRVWNLGRF